MSFKDRLLKIILWFSKVTTIPLDFFARKYPISAKGIIIHENKVLLLKNERNEWDLPGGKLENSDISIEDCLMREIKEETNLDVRIEQLEEVFVFKVVSWLKVVIVVYRCSIISNKANLKISGEHLDKKFFLKSEIDTINMNKTYYRIIQNLLVSEQPSAT